MSTNPNMKWFTVQVTLGGRFDRTVEHDTPATNPITALADVLQGVYTNLRYDVDGFGGIMMYDVENAVTDVKIGLTPKRV